MNSNTINIVHMYPDLLNLYGDNGNIECIKKRLEWRGFEVNIIECTSKCDDTGLDNVDIIFIGGGSDREQKIVSEKLLKKKDELKNYVEKNGVLIAVCGGFQLLGKYYETSGSMIEGLGILDIFTETGASRLIGNIVIKNSLFSQNIVGFENHAGRTYINDYSPLGKVIYGNGNDEISKNEGILYKNVIATYLHGPLLLKNPQLCDYILLKAIQNKMEGIGELKKLDDAIEYMANEYMVRRLL